MLRCSKYHFVFSKTIYISILFLVLDLSDIFLLLTPHGEHVALFSSSALRFIRNGIKPLS